MVSNPKKTQKKYICVYCTFNSNNNKDFNRHLQTIKHLSNANENIKKTEIYTIKNDYIPETFTSNNKQEYENYLQTIQQKTPKNPKKPQKTPKNKITNYICSCGKKYKDNSGLWRHKKKCNYKDMNIIDDNIVEFSHDKELIMNMLQQNQELQKSLIELSKEKSVVNNNNSKTFNLQFFLNETCKDALNIKDFVNSIKMNLSDLETTGRLGYVEGISQIIMKNLKSLEISQRPIHCSDLKRETLYIKDNDVWEKNNAETNKLASAIQDIAHENINQISEWSALNPEYMDSSSKKSDQYLKILGNAMSGASFSESAMNMEKIIRNVARVVTIGKNI